MRIGTLVIALTLLVPSAGATVQSQLGEAEIAEALAHGRALFERLRAAGEPIDDVEPAYRVDLGREVGFAVLHTEFSTIALEARRWLGIGRELTRADLDAALAPVRGRLRFGVTLVGAQRDFLRRYTARLRQASDRRAPASWDVFRGVQTPAGRWQASAVYTFAAGEVALTAPGELVLSDTTGGEIVFHFPLDRLR